jgi:hypothetical protein
VGVSLKMKKKNKKIIQNPLIPCSGF